MDKDINKTKEYKEAIKKLHKERIGIIGCFIFGFDEEKSNIFKRTVKYVKKLNIEVPQLTLLTPYPGTILREKMDKMGRIIHNQWEKYDVNHVVFNPLNLKIEELRAGYDKSCRRLYSHWSIFKRLFRSFFYLKSIYKTLVFLQINIVYRRLFLVSIEE